MVSFKAVLLLSLGAGALGASSVSCSTKFGTTAVVNLQTKTATTTKTTTTTKKLTTSKTLTVTPSPTTVTVTTTKTATKTKTADVQTDTATTTLIQSHLVTSTATKTDTATYTSTIFSSTVTTITSPAPAGFTPISQKQPPSFSPKKARNVAAPKEKRAGSGRYPQSVYCVKTIIKTVTSTSVSTKTFTTTLQKPTSTATATSTKTITTTKYPPHVTATTTEFASTTITTTSTSTTTTTSTTSSTSWVALPTLLYEACASNNIFRTANGNRPIAGTNVGPGDRTENLDDQSTDFDQYECCVACFTRTDANCAGSYSIVGHCVHVLSDTCSQADFSSSYFYTVGDPGIYAGSVSNGPCGLMAVRPNTQGST